jgi:hypothetical protein
LTCYCGFSRVACVSGNACVLIGALGKQARGTIRLEAAKRTSAREVPHPGAVDCKGRHGQGIATGQPIASRTDRSRDGVPGHGYWIRTNMCLICAAIRFFYRFTCWLITFAIHADADAAEKTFGSGVDAFVEPKPPIISLLKC